MYYYSLYGLRLESDVEMRQLVLQTAEQEKLPQDVVICEESFPNEYKREEICYSHIAMDVSYVSNNTCYLLMTEGKKLTYELKKGGPGCRPDYLVAYILGWGMASIMHQLRRPAIHCSAVSRKVVREDGTVEKEAILVTGRSGSGKSTITTMLLENGWTLMADDIAAVAETESDGIYISPAFPYQKLCRDAAERVGLNTDDLIYIDEDKDKFLVKYEGDFSVEPVKLKAAFFLIRVREDVPFEFSEILGAAKLPATIEANFLKPLFDNSQAEPTFIKTCLNIAQKVPYYRILRPVDKDTRAEIMENINKVLAK